MTARNATDGPEVAGPPLAPPRGTPEPGPGGDATTRGGAAEPAVRLQTASTDPTTADAAPAANAATPGNSEATVEGGSPTPGFWDLEALLGGGRGLPGLLMAAGMLIIVGLMLRRLRARARQAAREPQPSGRERLDRIRTDAAQRSRVDAYKADAEQFTREMAALLDNRAARLEALIADADDRLARLEAATASDGRGHPRHAGPDGAGHGYSESVSAAPSHRRDQSLRLPDLAPAGGADPLHAKIYSLADEGVDTVEIARRTGQPTGQVELILALRA